MSHGYQIYISASMFHVLAWVLLSKICKSFSSPPVQHFLALLRGNNILTALAAVAAAAFAINLECATNFPLTVVTGTCNVS